MASVTITFTDNNEHGVSVHSDHVPAAGQSLTPAQAAGLDTYMRACHQWGCSADVLAKQIAAAQVQIANYGSAPDGLRHCGQVVKG